MTRRFGKVVALSSLNLQIERGIFFSLLGPSGCGKTTVLRLIAGLDAPDEGVISIEGTDVRSVPPNRRPVNTVFQSYALFPHMTVEENISFGPRMRNEKPDAIQERANEVMRLTRTESFSARRPHQLSGGQKQRVALARALVNRPSILLLDEPLAALDLKLREELRDQLKELQRATKTTFIYVTHDQTEALAMSDSIAIMDAGKILQQGAGAELYRAPQTSFVAEFLGRANILAATLVRREGQLLWARFGDQEIKFAGSSSANLGDEILLSLRLEAGQIHRPVDSHENAFSGVLQNIIHLGPQVEMQMRVNQKIIRHLLPAAAADLLELRRGEPVTLTLSPDEITLLAS